MSEIQGLRDFCFDSSVTFAMWGFLRSWHFLRLKLIVFERSRTFFVILVGLFDLGGIFGCHTTLFRRPIKDYDFHSQFTKIL